MTVSVLPLLLTCQGQGGALQDNPNSLGCCRSTLIRCTCNSLGQRISVDPKPLHHRQDTPLSTPWSPPPGACPPRATLTQPPWRLPPPGCCTAEQSGLHQQQQEQQPRRGALQVSTMYTLECGERAAPTHQHTVVSSPCKNSAPHYGVLSCENTLHTSPSTPITHPRPRISSSPCEAVEKGTHETHLLHACRSR